MPKSTVITSLTKKREPPGPQKKTSHFNKKFATLHLLILLFLGLLVVAFLKENFPDFLADQIISLHLISTVESIRSLLVLFSLHLVQRGAELNFRPYISYKSGIEEEKSEKKKKWLVYLLNNGNGAAIIERLEYRLVKNDSNKINDLAQINTFLEEVCRDKKFQIFNISKGYSISSRGETKLLEIPLDSVEQIREMDLRVYFKSFLGQVYYKDIFLMPSYRK